MKPVLMICGHTHEAEVRYPGHEKDAYGQPCPLVVASGYDDKTYWIGCGFTFGDGRAEAVLTDSEGRKLQKWEISYCERRKIE